MSGGDAMSARVVRRLRRAGVRGVRAVAFLGHFGQLFLKANLIVAREIVTPGSGLAPAIIFVSLRSRTRLEIVAIAHLITLTPGTLVLEVHTNPPALYVHGMHAADPDGLRAHLTDLENRLLAVLRPEVTTNDVD